jgi:hypothetical protein
MGSGHNHFMPHGFEQDLAYDELIGIVVGHKNPGHKTYLSRSSSWILVSVLASRYFTITGV